MFDSLKKPSHEEYAKLVQKNLELTSKVDILEFQVNLLSQTLTELMKNANATNAVLFEHAEVIKQLMSISSWALPDDLEKTTKH